MRESVLVFDSQIIQARKILLEDGVIDINKLSTLTDDEVEKMILKYYVVFDSEPTLQNAGNYLTLINKEEFERLKLENKVKYANR